MPLLPFRFSYSLFLLAVLLAVQAPSLRAQTASAAGEEYFEKHIRPVLASRCYVCHGAKSAQVQGGLLLDSKAGLLQGGISGPVLAPGDPEASLLIKALRHTDAIKMPPGKPLADEVIRHFEEWVRMGAPDPRGGEAAPVRAAIPEKAREFWSFQPPRLQPLPEVKRKDWVRTDVDAFVLKALEAKGLAPSPEADRYTLIRRVTLDLTGLPPTYEEVQAFVKDRSPDAYEKLVDRLLASHRYGERWARHWMDVARYADTRDRGARFAFSYTYRDWVIRALNEDMPYDQFVKKQVAADLLPGAQKRDLVALGFITLGRSVPKGEHDMIDDRIDAVTRGLLGLTVTCARCHDHKYDPIPTQDYYSFYGIIANSEEPVEYPLVADLGADDGLEALYTEGMRARLAAIDEFKTRRHAELVAEFRSAEWIARYLLAAQSAAKFNNREIEKLSQERDYNLFVLRRWRDYLNRMKKDGDPVWVAWNAFAALGEAEFPAKAAQVAAGLPEAANPVIAESFRKEPPQSMEEVAERYGKLLAEQDGVQPRPDQNREALRLVLRADGAPANVPLEDFMKIRGPGGDDNIIRGLNNAVRVWQAELAYRGLTPRAMALEDTTEPQPAHVFVRGNANDRGIEAPRRFLAVLSKPEAAPFSGASGRQDLAEAIASEENPLTARVIVNRVWAWHFGRGLVATPSDFGLRGEAPSHPELLDHLARKFMEEGWSLKKLHREIVLSAAYRQASEDRAEARAVDPENKLLWRMNRQRLDYETLRDSMLQASGRLDLAMGGPPFSPTALPSVPRRTVYGYVERGRLPGELTAFDFANPEAHVPVRFATTVPQQALYLMNSPFVAEQAISLASRPKIAEVQGEERIRRMYRVAFGRDATEEEIALGLAYVKAEPPAPVAKPAEPLWRYGLGRFGKDGVKNFQEFAYFDNDRWMPASILPQPGVGNAYLSAKGGYPGDGADHAVVRRWIAPADGVVTIEGKLAHKLGDREQGDGVEAAIFHRGRVLARETVRDCSQEIEVERVTVRQGESIDFVVGSGKDFSNDDFQWDPVITMNSAVEAGPNEAPSRKFQASEGFAGPGSQVLSPWAKYAQVLLETAEFAFVD